jgi:hypothetical protein
VRARLGGGGGTGRSGGEEENRPVVEGLRRNGVEASRAGRPDDARGAPASAPTGAFERGERSRRGGDAGFVQASGRSRGSSTRGRHAPFRLERIFELSAAGATLGGGWRKADGVSRGDSRGRRERASARENAASRGDVVPSVRFPASRRRRDASLTPARANAGRLATFHPTLRSRERFQVFGVSPDSRRGAAARRSRVLA